MTYVKILCKQACSISEVGELAHARHNMLNSTMMNGKNVTIQKETVVISARKHCPIADSQAEIGTWYLLCVTAALNFRGQCLLICRLTFYVGFGLHICIPDDYSRHPSSFFLFVCGRHK
jgi:hypothetical protein